jgi:hypothetical protein
MKQSVFFTIDRERTAAHLRSNRRECSQCWICYEFGDVLRLDVFNKRAAQKKGKKECSRAKYLHLSASTTEDQKTPKWVIVSGSLARRTARFIGFWVRLIFDNPSR